MTIPPFVDCPKQGKSFVFPSGAVNFCWAGIGWHEVMGMMVISAGRPQAVAWVRGENGLRGSVTFYPVPGGTLVTAELQGLPKSEAGFFGFHIHEGEGCGGVDFGDTKGHLNPEFKSSRLMLRIVSKIAFPQRIYKSLICLSE